MADENEDNSAPDNPYKICPKCSRVLDRVLSDCPECHHHFGQPKGPTTPSVAPAPPAAKCDYCLMEIPIGAAVCGHCGREQLASVTVRVARFEAAVAEEKAKNQKFIVGCLWVILGAAALFMALMTIVGATHH